MFKNREEAARELAIELEVFKKENPLILAIPRGGVEIGYYLAQELDYEWAVIVTRKLGHPQQPEAAFGAIAEDKSLYFNPRAKTHLSQNLIERVIKKEEKEIERRIKAYRNGASLPPLKDRTVILVDDGIATGATCLASILMCKNAGVRSIIVAAPVAAIEVAEQLLGKVDEVVLLETPRNFYAVSQAYHHFKNLTDIDVLRFLGNNIVTKYRSKMLAKPQ